MIVHFIDDNKREGYRYDNVIDMHIGPKQTMLKIEDNTGKIFTLVVFAEEYTQIIVGGNYDNNRKETER